MSIIQPPDLFFFLYIYISFVVKIKSDFFIPPVRSEVRGRSKSYPRVFLSTSPGEVCIFLNILPHSFFMHLSALLLHWLFSRGSQSFGGRRRGGNKAGFGEFKIRFSIQEHKERVC